MWCLSEGGACLWLAPGNSSPDRHCASINSSLVNVQLLVFSFFSVTPLPLLLSSSSSTLNDLIVEKGNISALLLHSRETMTVWVFGSIYSACHREDLYTSYMRPFFYWHVLCYSREITARERERDRQTERERIYQGCFGGQVNPIPAYTVLSATHSSPRLLSWRWR